MGYDKVQQHFEEYIGHSNPNCGKLLIKSFQQLPCQSLASKMLTKGI